MQMFSFIVLCLFIPMKALAFLEGVPIEKCSVDGQHREYQYHIAVSQTKEHLDAEFELYSEHMSIRIKVSNEKSTNGREMFISFAYAGFIPEMFLHPRDLHPETVYTLTMIDAKGNTWQTSILNGIWQPETSEHYEMLFKMLETSPTLTMALDHNNPNQNGVYYAQKIIDIQALNDIIPYFNDFVEPRLQLARKDIDYCMSGLYKMMMNYDRPSKK